MEIRYLGKWSKFLVNLFCLVDKIYCARIVSCKITRLINKPLSKYSMSEREKRWSVCRHENSILLPSWKCPQKNFGHNHGGYFNDSPRDWSAQKLAFEQSWNAQNLWHLYNNIRKTGADEIYGNDRSLRGSRNAHTSSGLRIFHSSWKKTTKIWQ